MPLIVIAAFAFVIGSFTFIGISVALDRWRSYAHARSLARGAITPLQARRIKEIELAALSARREAPLNAIMGPRGRPVPPNVFGNEDISPADLIEERIRLFARLEKLKAREEQPTVIDVTRSMAATIAIRSDDSAPTEPPDGRPDSQDHEERDTRETPMVW